MIVGSRPSGDQGGRVSFLLRLKKKGNIMIQLAKADKFEKTLLARLNTVKCFPEFFYEK